MNMLSLVILCIGIIIPVIRGQDSSSSISLYPKAHALYEGDVAVFNCTSYRFDHIVWRMNDNTTADHMGLKPQLMKEEGDEKRLVSQLQIPGHVLFNESKISCMGVSFVPSLYPSKFSQDGILLVQGTPGKVLNFIGTNITSTRLQFTWSPPHHIPGIPPCCHGYSINITNTMSYEVLFDGNINETEIFIDVEPEFLCSVYEVTIAAYNKLGEGEPISTKWSLGGYFEASEASFALAYNKEMDLNVHFNVTVDGYCLNDLDNITLTVQCDSSPDSILSKTDKISAERHLTKLHTDISMVIPESLHNTQCESEIALENNVDLHGISFATHDIIDTNITVLPGVICVSCDYLPRSPAMGCVLIVSPVGINSDVQSFVNVPINSGRGCLRNIKEGRYRVRVYDWENDNGRSGQYVHQSVEYVQEPVIPSANGSSTEGSKDDNSNTEIIIIGVTVPVAVIFVGVALVIVIGVVIYKVLKDKKHEYQATGDDEIDGVVSPFLHQLEPFDKRERLSNHEQLKEIVDFTGNKWSYFNTTSQGKDCIVLVKE